MTYTFKQNLVPSSKYSIKAPYAMQAETITVHNTANDASAANEVAYHNRNDNQVSYHVAIDDKYVIQCVPFNRTAWHAGDGKGKGNMKSIGIEICYSKSGGAKYKAAEENAVQYIAKLLFERGWGVDRVKKHQDWSGKYCPHRILAEERWESFKDRIEVALVKLKKPKEVSKVANTKVDVTINLLNETGRKEARALIKRACDEGVFDAKYHTDAKVDKYADVELISYSIAYVNRTVK